MTMTLSDREQSEVDALSPSQQKHYHKCRLDPETNHRLAVMLASRQAPTFNDSNDKWAAEKHRDFARQSEDTRQMMLEDAAAAGVAVSGKYHCEGIGDASNPEAWCSTRDEEVSRIKKIADQTGGYVEKLDYVGEAREKQ